MSFMKEIEAVKPWWLEVYALPSSWMNQKLLRRILRLLATALVEVQKDRLVILVMDSARCHIHKDIINEACRQGFWVIFVPAKLTWLLQPLDTHIFRHFKARLRKKYMSMRLLSEDGKLSKLQWFLMLRDVIAETFLHVALELPGIFDKVGITHHQRELSPFVSSFVRDPDVLMWGSNCPTEAELTLLGGRRVIMPHLQLTRPVLLQSTGALAETYAELLAAEPHVWLGRTRSARALPSPAVAPGAPPALSIAIEDRGPLPPMIARARRRLQIVGASVPTWSVIPRGSRLGVHPNSVVEPVTGSERPGGIAHAPVVPPAAPFLSIADLIHGRGH
jgi:hypothetical protein